MPTRALKYQKKLTDEFEINFGVFGGRLPEVHSTPVDPSVFRPQGVDVKGRGDNGSIRLGKHARLLEAEVGPVPAKSGVVCPVTPILATHVKAETKCLFYQTLAEVYTVPTIPQ